ncbi:MAG: hypothetical protein AB1487_04780 [Thermodesulfobacteriota bacterium]
MTIKLALKASGIWLIMVVMAIVNGVFREKVLLPNLGQNIALPLSGTMLSFFIFLIAYLAAPYFGKNDGITFIFIGLQWVSMTLLFEFLFGHYVSGKSWREIFQVFNILKGNLFIFALVISLGSPFFAAKLRGFLLQ